MRFIDIQILVILGSMLCVATMVITSTKEVPCEILPNGVIAITGEGPNGKIKRSEEATVINRTMCTIPVYSPVVRIAQKTLDQVFEESNIPVTSKNDTVGKNESLCNGVMLDLDMCLSNQQASVLAVDTPANTGKGKSKRLIRKKRKIVSDVTARWPENTIPYEIHESDFSIMELKTIIDALTEYEMKTCIIFKPATPEDKNKLVIMGGRGCYSNIGMIGGTQRLVLDRGNCRKKRVIMHELGHAIGMVHEHQRYDRDNYITIVRENVRPAVLDQFKKFSRNVVDIGSVPYDYLSIMHYGKSFFSADGFSTTIRTNNPNYQDLIGRTEQLSFIDVKAVNLMYRCNARCPDAKSIRCPSDGYQDKFCVCRCSDSSKCGKSAGYGHSYGTPLAIASKNGPYYKIQSPIRSDIIQRAPLTRAQIEALNGPQTQHQEAFIQHPDFHQIVHQPSFFQPSFGNILSPFQEPFFQPQPFDISTNQQPFYQVSNPKTVNVPVQSQVAQESVTPQPDPLSSTQNIINDSNLNHNKSVQKSLILGAQNQETAATPSSIDINDQLYTTDAASQQDMLANLMTSGIGFEVVVGPQDNMTPNDLVLDLSQISQDQQLLILQQLQLQQNDSMSISSTKATSKPEPLIMTTPTIALLNESTSVSNYSKPKLQSAVKEALEQIKLGSSVIQQQQLEAQQQVQQSKQQKKQQNQKQLNKQHQAIQEEQQTIQEQTQQLKQQKGLEEQTTVIQQVIGTLIKEPQKHKLQHSQEQRPDIKTESVIHADKVQTILSNDIKNQQQKLHQQNMQLHIDVLHQQQEAIKDQAGFQSTPPTLRQHKTIVVSTKYQETQALTKQIQQQQQQIQQQQQQKPTKQQHFTNPSPSTVLEQSKSPRLQPTVPKQKRKQTITTIQPTPVPEKSQKAKLQKSIVKQGEQQQQEIKAVQWKFPLQPKTNFESTKFPKPPSAAPFLQSKTQTKMITPAIQPTIVPAQPQRIELQKLMVKRGDQQQLKVKEVQQKFPLKQDTFTTKPTRFPKPPSIDRQKKLTSQPLLHRSIQTKLITPMLQEEDREQQFSNNNVSQNGRQQPVTQAPPVTKQFEGRSQRNQEVLQLISHPKQVKQQNIQLPKQLSTESHLTYTHQVREQQQTTPLSPTRSQQTQFHQASQSQINRKQMHHQQKLQEHGLSSYKKKHFQHGANEAQQIILQRQKQRQQLYQKPELQQQQNRQQHQQQKQQQKQEQQQQVKQSVLKRVSDSKKMPKQKRQPARQQFLQQQRRRQHQQRQLKRQQEQQQIQQQQQVIKPELVQKHQVLRQQQPSAKKRLSESTNMYRQQANQQFIQQKRQQQKQKQLRQQQNVRKPKHVQQQKPSEIKRLSESKKIPQQYRQQEKQQFFQQQVRKSQVQQQKPSERKRLSEGKNMPMQKRQQARQQFFQQQRQQQQQQSVIKQLSERKNIPTPQRQQSKQHVQQQPLRKPGSSHLSTRRPMKQPNHQLLKTNFIQNGTQQLQLQQQSRQLQLQLQQKQLKLQSQKKQIELLQKKQLLQSKLRRHKIARQSKLIQLSQENKFKERSSKPNIQYPKNIRKMIDNTTETQKHQSATVVGSSQNRLQTTATKSNGRPQIKIEIQNRNQHNIQVNLKQSPKTHLALGQNNIRKPIAFRQQGVAYSKQNSINRPIQLKTKLPSPIITKNSQNGKQRRLGRVLNQGKFSTQTTKNQKIIKLLPNRGNVSRRRKQQVNTRPQLKPLKTNNKAKQTTTLQKNQRTVATRPQYNTRSQISKTKTAAVKEVSKIQPIKGKVAPIQQKKANFSSQIKSKQRLPQVARRKLLVRLNSRNLQQQRLLKTRTKSKSSNRVEQNRNRKIGILRVLKPRPNNRSNTGQLSRSTWTRGIQQPQRGLWGSLPFYAVGRYPSENESTMATGIPEVQIYPSGNDANDIAAVSLGKSTTALPKTPQPLNVVRLTTV